MTEHKEDKTTVYHISNQTDERWREKRKRTIHSITFDLNEGNYYKPTGVAGASVAHVLNLIHPFTVDKYKLPLTLPVETEAGSTPTKSSTSRTVLIYELKDGSQIMFAPLTSVVVTRSGRTVKRTNIGSYLLTPHNVDGIIVMKLKTTRTLLGDEITYDVKCTQYGQITWPHFGMLAVIDK